MYSYLNELTLYAGVLYTQPSGYSFSSWPHSDITSLGHSVTCTFLALPFFYSRDVFGIGIRDCGDLGFSAQNYHPKTSLTFPFQQFGSIC